MSRFQPNVDSIIDAPFRLRKEPLDESSIDGLSHFGLIKQDAIGLSMSAKAETEAPKEFKRS